MQPRHAGLGIDRGVEVLAERAVVVEAEAPVTKRRSLRAISCSM
jgi:hypothetical protein